MYTYRVAGLSVSSEVALPGMIATRANGGTPDVTICEGVVPDRLATDGASDSLRQIAGERCLLRIPGVSRILLTAGREIVFQKENGVPAGDVAIFLSGAVFGALLHQRENIVVHASAVRVNGRAVMFCGPSGAGKSTIAAALVQRGHALIADEMSKITFTTAPTVWPDGRYLRLSADAIDRIGLAANRRSSLGQRIEKWFVEPKEAVAEAVPVAAVYVTREASASTLHIERPAAVARVALLAQNAYRPELVSDPDHRGRYFRAMAAIANAVGVYRLTRPIGFASMSEVVERLEQHFDREHI